MPNPPTPTERFATLRLSLSQAANPKSLVGRLVSPLLLLIMEMLSSLEQSFAQLAARIEADRLVACIEADRPVACIEADRPGACIEADRPGAGDPVAPRPPIRRNRPRRPHRSRCRRRKIGSPPARRRTAGHRVRPAWERPENPLRLRNSFGLPYPPPLPDPAASGPVPWHAHIVP